MRATQKLQQQVAAYYNKARVCNVPREVAERILTSEIAEAAKLPNRTTFQALERASNRLAEMSK